MCDAELRYYHLVPEWITGMGIVVGQGLMTSRQGGTTLSREHATGRVRSGDVEIFYRRFGRPGRHRC